MGAILVARTPPGGKARDIVSRMAEVSPERGELELIEHGGCAVGVQSLGWDGAVAEHKGLCIALHGYVCVSEMGSRSQRLTVAELAELWWTEELRILPKLDGEFAVAVIERDSHKLFAACSVGGTRPLFWGKTGEAQVLATELRQVRAGLGLEPELDRETFEQMAYHRFVPRERTLDRQVSRIYPSRLYRFRSDSGDGRPESKPYWEPALPRPVEEDWTFEESVEQLRSVLRGVVEDTIPDRPWALSLSGGMDSGSIWAKAAGAGAPDGRPISLRFPDMDCDESQLIEAIVEKTGASEPLWVDAAQIDPEAASQALLSELDAFPHPTTYLLGLIAEKAVEDGRRVLLTGHGGDDWLGESPGPYLCEPFLRGRVRTGVVGLFTYQLPPWASRTRVMWATVVRPLLSRMDTTIGRRQRAKLKWEQLAAHAEAVGDPKAGGDWLQGPVRAHLNRYLHQRRIDNQFWAIEQLLARRGCEWRAPLMHRRVIEFSYLVPNQHVVDGRRSKHLLRTAMEGRLPEAVMDRRWKTIFNSLYKEQTGTPGEIQADLTDKFARLVYKSGQGETRELPG